jgi:hypothetical protein
LPRDGTPDIRVTGLRKSYGDVVAVDAIDLEVARGVLDEPRSVGWRAGTGLTSVRPPSGAVASEIQAP